jgi:hypothetical protein
LREEKVEIYDIWVDPDGSLTRSLENSWKSLAKNLQVHPKIPVFNVLKV